MVHYKIDSIYVNPECRDSEICRNFLAAYPEVRVVVQAGPPATGQPGSGYTVHLLPGRRTFLKPCPCTPRYLGCGYLVMNTVTNCTLDCSYCILQSYLHTRIIQVFTDMDEVCREVDSFLRQHPHELYRIGTGELSDSLIFDGITGSGARLVRHFRDCGNGILELKTKTASIEHLLPEKHGGRTVMAWSLNPEKIAASEEAGSPPPAVRLQAAVRCLAAGYPLAFHFDPVLDYPGWRDGYTRLIADIFQQVPSAAVAWISLGSLRYMPDLEEIAGARHPASRIFHGEMIRGLDGKNRYFIDRRIALYRHLVRELRRVAPEVPLYFCMESEDVWKLVLGWAPAGADELRRFLTARFRGGA